MLEPQMFTLCYYAAIKCLLCCYYAALTVCWVACITHRYASYSYCTFECVQYGACIHVVYTYMSTHLFDKYMRSGLNRIAGLAVRRGLKPRCPDEEALT